MYCSGDKTEYCGAGNRLSVYTIPKPASSTSSATASASSSTSTSSATTYMNCYSDNNGGRALLTRLSTTSSSVDACQAAAQKANLNYFGLEYGGECWAGNTIATTSTVIASGSCSMACNSNSTQKCGGPNALSMYRNNLYAAPSNPSNVTVSGQTTQYRYMGCYTEGSAGRTIGSSSASTSAYSTSNTNMTVENCAAACYAKGFSFFGVEYSSECYCNNAGVVNGGAIAPSADCSMVCAGNKSQYCGGSGRLSVYSVATATQAKVKAKSKLRRYDSYSG